MKYFEDCFNKAKGFMFEPTKTFKNERKTGMGEAFKYFLSLGIPFTVLISLWIAFISNSAIVFLFVSLGIYFVLITGSIITALILHLIAYIYGAKQGLEQTFKVVFYSATPGLLLGWIPIVGIAFSLWNIVVEVVGLSVLQKMSTGRAVLTILTPVIILGALFLIGLFMFFATASQTGMIPLELFDGLVPSQTGCNPFNPTSGFPFCG